MRKISFGLSLIVVCMMSWEQFLVIPGLGSASRVIGVLAGAFWLFTILVTGKFRKIIPFHGFIILFVLWNATSILWTINPSRTLTQIITYVQMGILSLMIWDLYTTPEAIKAGLQAYILGLTVPLVSTVANFLASVGTVYALYGRYSASGSNANTTGILLAMGIPFAWYLATSASEGKIGKVQRLVNYAYIPAIMFGVMLTGTRFAFIMSGPAFLFGLGTFTKLKPSLRVLIFALLAIVFFAVSSLIPSALFQRLGTIDDELQGGDLSERSELWQAGIDIWLEHPVIGIGSAGFDVAVRPTYGRQRSVHNSFIAIAAELGIIGLGLFSIILVMAILHALSHPTRLDAQFWLTVLLCWGLGNLALTWVYAKPTWLILNLVVASASLSWSQATPKPQVASMNGSTPTIPPVPALHH